MKIIKASIKIFLSIGLSLGLQAQQISEKVAPYVSVNESAVAITNVTLIDGTGSPAKQNQDIVFKDNVIIAIGPTGTIELPKTGKVLNGEGKTVTPGFIMMHEHLFYGKPQLNLDYKAYHMPFTFAKMYLAGGVTTMRTAGSLEANADLNVKNLINSGAMPGPDIDVSTPQIDRGGTNIPQVKSLYKGDNIEDWLDYWFNKGVTSVKIYNYVSRDDVQKIITHAHKKGIKVTGHLCSVTYKEAIAMGIDNFEHSFNAATDFVKGKKLNECVSGASSLAELDINDSQLTELMKLLIKNNVTLTYTPTVFEPESTSELVPGGGAAALSPDFLAQRTAIHNALAKAPTAKALENAFKKEMDRVKKFYEMGGKLTVGTDPTGAGKTIAGYANFRAIELLKETGFSIEEVIKIASLNGASYLGIENKTGTLTVGKQADLILINGDLTQDIKHVRKIETVFKDGIGYDSKKIFESVKGRIGM